MSSASVIVVGPPLRLIHLASRRGSSAVESPRIWPFEGGRDRGCACRKLRRTQRPGGGEDDGPGGGGHSSVGRGPRRLSGAPRADRVRRQGPLDHALRLGRERTG